MNRKEQPIQCTDTMGRIMAKVIKLEIIPFQQTIDTLSRVPAQFGMFSGEKDYNLTSK